MAIAVHGIMVLYGIIAAGIRYGINPGIGRNGSGMDRLRIRDRHRFFPAQSGKPVRKSSADQQKPHHQEYQKDDQGDYAAGKVCQHGYDDLAAVTAKTSSESRTAIQDVREIRQNERKDKGSRNRYQECTQPADIIPVVKQPVRICGQQVYYEKTAKAEAPGDQEQGPFVAKLSGQVADIHVPAHHSGICQKALVSLPREKI